MLRGAGGRDLTCVTGCGNNRTQQQADRCKGGGALLHFWLTKLAPLHYSQAPYPQRSYTRSSECVEPHDVHQALISTGRCACRYAARSMASLTPRRALNA